MCTRHKYILNDVISMRPFISHLQKWATLSWHQ